MCWAGAVCAALKLTVLILDSQAIGKGRFVAQGPPHSGARGSKYFVILHRTRRQHYNYITVEGRALFERQDLPLNIAQRWNVVGQSSDEEGWERKEHERDSSVCSSASRSNGAAGNAGENADGENEREPTGVTSMCNLKRGCDAGQQLIANDGIDPQHAASNRCSASGAKRRRK